MVGGQVRRKRPAKRKPYVGQTKGLRRQAKMRDKGTMKVPRGQ